jgi:hypothetical protein
MGDNITVQWILVRLNFIPRYTSGEMPIVPIILSVVINAIKNYGNKGQTTCQHNQNMP